MFSLRLGQSDSVTEEIGHSDSVTEEIGQSDSVSKKLGESIKNPGVNIRMWAYNTDLRHSVEVLRFQLMLEAKHANPSMRQKIFEWTRRDYHAAAARIQTKESPIAKENESMRQLLSDLLNGPIASLLNKDGERRLRKLSVPALPECPELYESCRHKPSWMSVISKPMEFRPFEESTSTSDFFEWDKRTWRTPLAKVNQIDKKFPVDFYRK